MAAIALGIFCVAAWSYLLLLHGNFWRTDKTGFQADLSPQISAKVVAVVPARNEAENIERCVASLLSQRPPALVHVIVVDDQSTDGTASKALESAAGLGRSGDLSIVHGAALPAGWSGKVWAMQQGVLVAERFRPDFLLFTDADVEHGPDNVSLLLSKAAEGFDLVSQMVRLHCRARAEKWLIPAFVYFFFQLYPPFWIANARRKTAGAAGGCILIRPECLRQSGGLESIRAGIIDDCALARAAKRSGGRIYLGLSGSTQSLREYGSTLEIRKMISRTAFTQLQHSLLLLWLAIVLMSMVYLAPIALWFSGCFIAMILGLCAWVLMTVSYVPMVRFFGLKLWWSLSLPFSAAFYMYATLRSAIDFYRGTGGEWKQRFQDRR